MGAAMIDHKTVRRVKIPNRHSAAEGGFTLIEVMISMCVLTVGLVSLLGVFGLAMANTQTSQQDLIAKQLANEAYESIVTARNTSQISWDDIQNPTTSCPLTNAASCGIFASGLQSINQATTTGTYAGILGTTYDSSQPVQSITDPGPDGIFGNSDDTTIPLTAYQRQITISTVCDPNSQPAASLRGVTVAVQYATTQGQTKTYLLNSCISQYQ